MDPNEFEIPQSNINPNTKYDDDVEFLLTQLDHIAHAAGRYSRSVQVPIAFHIIKKLKEMWNEVPTVECDNCGEMVKMQKSHETWCPSCYY